LSRKVDECESLAYGQIFGTSGDYRLVTFFADGGCDAAGTYNSFCAGPIDFLHGHRDAWVAKVSLRPDTTTQLTVAWVTAVGGTASDVITDIVHDEVRRRSLRMSTQLDVEFPLLLLLLILPVYV
jgi:hypothetical protein